MMIGLTGYLFNWLFDAGGFDTSDFSRDVSK